MAANPDIVDTTKPEALVPDTANTPVTEPLINVEVQDRLLRELKRRLFPSDVEGILYSAIVGDLYWQDQLWSLMVDTWPRLQTNLGKLKQAVSSMEYAVYPFTEGDEEPTDSAQEKADFVEDALFGMHGDVARQEHDFEQTLEDITDSLIAGFTVMEVYWEARNGGIMPQCTRWLPARYYRYPYVLDDIDRLMLNPSGMLGGTQLVDFPPYKFLVCVKQSHANHPIFTSPMRCLTAWWIASRFGLEWMMSYAQLFGIPQRIAYYQPGDDIVYQKLVQMMRASATATWGVYPVNTKVEVLGTAGGGGAMPQERLVEEADKVCDIMLLGQTLTTEVRESGGNRALGMVHHKVMDEILEAASRYAAKVLSTQLIPGIIQYNFGSLDELPTLAPVIKDPVDLFNTAQAYNILFNQMQVPVLNSELYERIEFTKPNEGDDVYKPPAIPAPAAPFGAPQPQPEGTKPQPEHAPNGNQPAALKPNIVERVGANNGQRTSAAFDPDEARDKEGKWTSEGGGEKPDLSGPEGGGKKMVFQKRSDVPGSKKTFPPKIWKRMETVAESTSTTGKIKKDNAGRFWEWVTAIQNIYAKEVSGKMVSETGTSEPPISAENLHGHGAGKPLVEVFGSEDGDPDDDDDPDDFGLIEARHEHRHPKTGRFIPAPPAKPPKRKVGVKRGEPRPEVGLMCKHSQTMEDNKVCQACKDICEEGWIPIDEEYLGYSMNPPHHRNCRCSNEYKTVYGGVNIFHQTKSGNPHHHPETGRFVSKPGRKVRAAFDPGEARDEEGKWTAGPGGPGAQPKKKEKQGPQPTRKKIGMTWENEGFGGAEAGNTPFSVMKEMYGENLKVYPGAGVAEQVKDLSRAPASVHGLLAKYIKISIGSGGNVTEVPGGEYLKELKGTPPGYAEGLTYNDCPALYDIGKSQILVGGQGGGIATSLHELGHAFDAKFHTKGEDLWDAYHEFFDNHQDEDSKRWYAYYMQDGRDGEAGRSEMFAEGFARYIKKGPEAVSLGWRAPKLADLIEKKIKQAGEHYVMTQKWAKEEAEQEAREKAAGRL